MRRLGLALLLCAVAPLPSCGGDSAAKPAAPTGVEAGTVLELEGAVTATRAGTTRPLAVGARVHDDDVIATGSGRVAIKLDRNQVVWRLGPELSQQVARSAAWTAPAAGGQVAATDEHSAAAGRHAEREAADTAASAAPAVAPPAMAPAPLPDQRELAKGVAPGRSGGGSRSADLEAMAEPAPPAPPPPPDRRPEAFTDLAVEDRVTGGGPGDDGKTGTPPPTVEPTDPVVGTTVTAPAAARAAVRALVIRKVWAGGLVSDDAVRAQVMAALDPLSACAIDLPAETLYVWRFRVDVNGRVDVNVIKGAAPALVTCFGNVAATWQFPAAKEAWTANVAFSAP